MARSYFLDIGLMYDMQKCHGLAAQETSPVT